MNRSTPNCSTAYRSKARNYRALAAECARQAELAVEEPHFREMQTRLARSYAALAETEEWLEGQVVDNDGYAPGRDRRAQEAA